MEKSEVVKFVFECITGDPIQHLLLFAADCMMHFANYFIFLRH